MNKLCFLLRWTWYLSQSVQAISSSLFCWPWALSQPHRNYWASPAAGSPAPVQHNNDFAEREKKKAPILGFCLPLRCWLFTKSSFQCGLRISQRHVGSHGLCCVSCSLPQSEPAGSPGLCARTAVPHTYTLTSSVTSLIIALHAFSLRHVSLFCGCEGNKGVIILKSRALPGRKGKMWQSRRARTGKDSPNWIVSTFALSPANICLAAILFFYPPICPSVVTPISPSP